MPPKELHRNRGKGRGDEGEKAEEDVESDRFSTESARRKRAKTWARWIARQSRKMFRAKPMPELMSPVWESRLRAMPQLINLTVQPRRVSGFDLEWPCSPKA
jgi:hypothetical protein